MARAKRGWRFEVASLSIARLRRAAAKISKAAAAIAVHSQKRESGWLKRRSKYSDSVREEIGIE